MTFAEVQSLICQKCHELIMAYQISLSNPTYLGPKEHNANAFKLEFQGGQELIKTFLLFQTNFDKKRPQQLSQNNNPFYLLCYAASLLVFLPEEHDMNIQEMQIAKPLFKSNDRQRTTPRRSGKVEFVGSAQSDFQLNYIPSTFMMQYYHACIEFN